jgi:hypothetical protein
MEEALQKFDYWEIASYFTAENLKYHKKDMKTLILALRGTLPSEILPRSDTMEELPTMYSLILLIEKKGMIYEYILEMSYRNY